MTFRATRFLSPHALGSVLALMLGVASSEAATLPDGDTLTPDHVARLQAVGSVAVSPDGSIVAYTRSVPRVPGVDEDGESWSELWLLDGLSGASRPYVTGKVNVGGVTWTPDGRGLVFLAKRGDDKFKGLYLLPVDGGEARRAAGLKSDAGDFSLSPDGTQVALLASNPEDDSRKKLKDKGFKQEIFEEDPRPTRVWISRLFETDSGKARALEITGSVRHVKWSPKGGLLAVAVTPTPSVDDGMMRQRIRMVDVETGAVSGEVDHQAKLGAMAWSPDGTRLAFIAGEDLHDPSAGRLYVVAAAGGRPVDVVPRFEGEVTGLEWTAPDTLVAVAAQGVWSTVLQVKLGDGAPTVTVLRGPGQPILSAFSASSDGRTLAFVGHAPTHPGEVFTAGPEAGSELKRRTDSNPGLGRIRWAKQEVIRHKARDGLELEGILIHPREAPANGRAPLLLTVHGGPESHVSDGWLSTYSNPGQVGAARGFAVFYPNYRGSTGRGVAFSKLGQGDAAGKEFDDLVDAVDHLVERGWVDRAKVGVTGGSYGGYATAWCSTRYSDRFAAGVMFVGISDKISKVGTTDIPDEEFLVHARKRPWDDWQFLLERSPIYHAGNCRTPLLILHGADDPRVHPGQSKELYRHLKLRSQAPVRLVLYPGEGHGNRKAAAKYDYQLRMLQWFAHYLQGAGGAMPGSDLDYGLPAKAE